MSKENKKELITINATIKEENYEEINKNLFLQKNNKKENVPQNFPFIKEKYHKALIQFLEELPKGMIYENKDTASFFGNHSKDEFENKISFSKELTAKFATLNQKVLKSYLKNIVKQAENFFLKDKENFCFEDKLFVFTLKYIENFVKTTDKGQLTWNDLYIRGVHKENEISKSFDEKEKKVFFEHIKLCLSDLHRTKGEQYLTIEIIIKIVSELMKKRLHSDKDRKIEWNFAEDPYFAKLLHIPLGYTIYESDKIDKQGFEKDKLLGETLGYINNKVMPEKFIEKVEITEDMDVEEYKKQAQIKGIYCQRGMKWTFIPKQYYKYTGNSTEWQQRDEKDYVLVKKNGLLCTLDQANEIKKELNSYQKNLKDFESYYKQLENKKEDKKEGCTIC